VWKKIQVDEWISPPQTGFAFEQEVQYWKPYILNFAISALNIWVHNLRIHRDEYLDEAARKNLKTIHHYVTVALQNRTYLIGICESRLSIFDQQLEGKVIIEENYHSTNDVDGRIYGLSRLSTVPVDIGSYSCWKVVGHENSIFFFLCNDKEGVEIIFYSPSKDTWERQTPLRHKPNVTWEKLKDATFMLCQ